MRNRNIEEEIRDIQKAKIYMRSAKRYKRIKNRHIGEEIREIQKAKRHKRIEIEI